MSPARLHVLDLACHGLIALHKLLISNFQIFGAYCSTTWAQRNMKNDRGLRQTYFGTGETFLFSFSVRTNRDGKWLPTHYPWVNKVLNLELVSCEKLHPYVWKNNLEWCPRPWGHICRDPRQRAFHVWPTWHDINRRGVRIQFKCFTAIPFIWNTYIN